MSDAFFASAKDNWLSKESLPGQPLEKWDTRELGLESNLTSPYVPVIFGSPGASVSDNEINLNIDVFGSAFFMLSRYEEAIKDDRDSHGRFPSEASIAFQEGFLDRPVVNEYLELLWSCINHLWPGLQRKKRQSRKLISADLDRPYHEGSKHLTSLAKLVGGDLFRRKSPILASRSLANFYFARRGRLHLDPFFPFIDWIMDENEKAGNKVAFNLLADGSRYSLEDVLLREIVDNIHARGHEIGIHPGYDSYLDPGKTRLEADRWRQLMREQGIDLEAVGGRQHFLRWSTPRTANNLEKAGFTYDSTLAYADRPGFRCGTCYEYSFYDVLERRPLELHERPLIVMEQAVIGNGIKSSAEKIRALETMKSFKDLCEKYEGDFTLLWHNSQFRTAHEREVYRELL